MTFGIGISTKSVCKILQEDSNWNYANQHHSRQASRLLVHK